MKYQIVLAEYCKKLFLKQKVIFNRRLWALNQIDKRGQSKNEMFEKFEAFYSQLIEDLEINKFEEVDLLKEKIFNFEKFY